MKRYMLAATTVAAWLVLLTTGASRASASIVTYSLTSDHCSGGGCLGTATSAGTITTTDVSGGVQVNVTLNPGFQFVSTGFQTDFGFNLAGNPTISYTSVTSGFAATGGSPQSAGSRMMDGAGTFEYGVTCTACGNGGSNPQSGPLNFTISGVSTSSFELSSGNAANYFAADVIGAGGRTGAVDASVPNTSVPDGGMTVMLLGAALAGIETLRRRLSV